METIKPKKLTKKELNEKYPLRDIDLDYAISCIDNVANEFSNGKLENLWMDEENLLSILAMEHPAYNAYLNKNENDKYLFYQKKYNKLINSFRIKSFTPTLPPVE